jgi:NADPH-dependent 2,4-dienoyl-CoA reductase/sulfur reductase-like enzyme
MESVVVVGASLSGLRTAEALRAKGFAGSITIVGAESLAPYDRPPLSKSYLEGKRTLDQLSLRPSDPLVKGLDVDLRLGRAVSGLDPERQTVALGDDRPLPFDGLVIATGTSPRVLPGTERLPNVFSLRTVSDADAIRARFAPGARVVLIGAGFIGGEVASTAVTAGCVVTIIEAAPISLARQLGDSMGLAVSALHERNGVSLLTGATVTAVDEGLVRLADGSHHEYDVLVVGIGVQPNTGWLEGSGVDVSNGVLCDETLRVMVDEAPAANIVAVGDVARWPNSRFAYEGPVRIEHWTNAVESADHAAATLLGSPMPFTPVPYFWSDQHGKKIQFLGRAAGADEVAVVSGSIDDKFVALYRRGDRLVAALGVSSIKLLMGYRQRLLDGCSWDDAVTAASV